MAVSCDVVGVLVRGPAYVAGPVGLGEGGAQTQPVIRRPRLAPKGPCPSNGSLPPTNGRLDRSMSTLIAPSRVAARTTLTSQVFSEWPERVANSSALALTD